MGPDFDIIDTAREDMAEMDIANLATLLKDGLILVTALGQSVKNK